MADMRTSIIMELVDRVTAPVRRIRSAVSGLSSRMGFDRLAAQARRVKFATGGMITNLGNLTRRLAIMGGAAAGAVWGVERMVSSVADAGAELRNWSERLGVGVGWLQDWIYAGKQFGVQQDAMIDGFKELSLRTDEFVMTAKGPAAEAFQRLGIGPEELQKTQGNTEAIFDLVLSRIKDVENAAARQRIVDELFGGQAAEQMAELVSRPMSELRRMMREGRESGAFLSEDEIQQSREYNRQMTVFRQTLRGIHVTVVGEILPAITAWISRVQNLARANREAISERIISGLREFWSGLRRIGAAVSWAADRVGGFGNLILWVVGLLAGRFLVSVAVAVNEMRKFAFLLTGRAVAAIAMLSRGLIGLATRAIPAAVAGIAAMTRATVRWGIALMTTPIGWIIGLVAALAGAAYLIYKNWGGIVEWWNGLWSRLSDTITQGIQMIKEQLSPANLVKIGKDFVNGIWGGITEQWDRLTGWLSEKIQALTDWMPDWVKGKLGLDDFRAPGPASRSPESAMGPPASKSQGAAGYRTDVGGELRISIDAEGRPRVREARRRGPMDFSVESGLLGIAP